MALDVVATVVVTILRKWENPSATTTITIATMTTINGTTLTNWFAGEFQWISNSVICKNATLVTGKTKWKKKSNSMEQQRNQSGMCFFSATGKWWWILKQSSWQRLGGLSERLHCLDLFLFFGHHWILHVPGLHGPHDALQQATQVTSCHGPTHSENNDDVLYSRCNSLTHTGWTPGTCLSIRLRGQMRSLHLSGQLRTHVSVRAILCFLIFFAFGFSRIWGLGVPFSWA